MAIRSAFALLLLAAAASEALAQPQRGPGEGESCRALPQCLDRIRATDSRVMLVGSTVEQDMVRFGDAAVDALMPMLMDPDLRIRERAGLVLAQFPRIDPRHLPALVHAWRHGDVINSQGRGNGWLPRAIAATGTDEALALLWTDFERDSRESSNAQVLFGLARYGERLQPRMSEAMRACGVRWSDYCAGLVELLHNMDRRWPRPIPPAISAWGVQGFIDWTRAESTEARSAGAAQLGLLRHPAGLAPLQRALAEIDSDDAASRRNWAPIYLINQIVAYGEAAHGSAAQISSYLDGKYNETLRTTAALALGRLGDRSATAALIALEPELTDDWLLAYNVSESLGRLGARQAQSLLMRLASEHWHRGVRNNAYRALNAIAGGDFVRPEAAGDGQSYPPSRDEGENASLYTGELRFAGDDATNWCNLSDNERGQRLNQNPVGIVRWPSAGGMRLTPSAIDAATSVEIRRRIPISQAQGDVVAVLPVGPGGLVAFNGGEFGGGIFHLPAVGPARPLTTEPVYAVWRMRDRLYVAAGLAHLTLDVGRLYIIDPVRQRVERVIRLPASPHLLSVSSQRGVIVETSAGDLGVREDGSLVDAERLGSCDRE